MFETRMGDDRHQVDLAQQRLGHGEHLPDTAEGDQVAIADRGQRHVAEPEEVERPACGVVKNGSPLSAGRRRKIVAKQKPTSR
jgi:hypothetical protein